MSDSFGRRLRTLRQSAGLTLTGLAARSGLAFSTLWRLEEGKTSPSWQTLRKIADAVGCEPGDFAPKEKMTNP